MTCVCISYLPNIVDVYVYTLYVRGRYNYNAHATKHSPTIVVFVDVLIAVVAVNSVARRRLYECKYD